MDGGGSCLAELIWQRIIPGGVHMAEDHTWGSSYFELRKKIISGGGSYDGVSSLVEFTEMKMFFLRSSYDPSPR